MKKAFRAGLLIVTLGAVFAVPGVASAAQSCDSLTSLKLPDTTITAATIVQEGPFAPPAPPVAGARAGAPLPVPSFCRVQLTVAPQIHIEVWMPTTGWNGKFEGVGGGGFARHHLVSRTGNRAQGWLCHREYGYRPRW